MGLYSGLGKFGGGIPPVIPTEGGGPYDEDSLQGFWLLLGVPLGLRSGIGSTG